MFGALFRKLEARVDNAVESLLARAFVALFFIVAAGFATAALAYWLTSELGTLNGSLAVAAVFCVLGLIAAAVVSMRSSKSATEEVVEAEAAEAVESDANALGDTDRELLMAALTSAAPIALPGLLRTLMRNLPLTLLIGVVAFVLMQPARGAAHTAEPRFRPEPAE